MGFNRAVRQEVQGLVRCWRAEVGDGVGGGGWCTGTADHWSAAVEARAGAFMLRYSWENWLSLGHARLASRTRVVGEDLAPNQSPEHLRASEGLKACFGPGRGSGVGLNNLAPGGSS